jgi:hypothetical protein
MARAASAGDNTWMSARITTASCALAELQESIALFNQDTVTGSSFGTERCVMFVMS